MAQVSLLDSARARLLDAWHRRALSLKAVTFALIGLVNSLVDYGFFLLARMALSHSPAALSLFDLMAARCHCGAPATLLLITANMMSWTVAVSGSYILNSSITFAAESGRRLSVRHYLTFVVSGIAGLIANTATLIFVAQILSAPIWAAKGAAVLASFVVNFSLSHFYIFRVRPEPAAGNAEGV
jgi:putative flippase GtrA